MKQGADLAPRGYRFISETDTELLARCSHRSCAHMTKSASSAANTGAPEGQRTAVYSGHVRAQLSVMVRNTRYANVEIKWPVRWLPQCSAGGARSISSVAVVTD